uniref:Uncharacterized protein n=3 Tax=Guillardia theta TaxID=55529 RepID=A0A7S4P5B4_GUITH|mmetsp:Transcript_43374/g.137113  ORF Transcript_43374/g.137113 Transcript_43374/m.137113 type:complete len:175 (+) Transcript_43374:1002-1526(+)
MLQRQFEVLVLYVTVNRQALQVENMFRCAMRDNDDVKRVHDRVQELLQFIDELKRLAKFLGLGNHGLVFQELLGLSNSGNKKEESIITGLVKLDQYLEPDRIAQLCRHVDDLRMLLRLKVQDGSDLQTAAKTLRDSYHFFVSLQRHAGIISSVRLYKLTWVTVRICRGKGNNML